jgi:hypothetical protein
VKISNDKGVLKISTVDHVPAASWFHLGELQFKRYRGVIGEYTISEDTVIFDMVSNWTWMGRKGVDPVEAGQHPLLPFSLVRPGKTKRLIRIKEVMDLEMRFEKFKF